MILKTLQNLPCKSKLNINNTNMLWVFCFTTNNLLNADSDCFESHSMCHKLQNNP